MVLIIVGHKFNYEMENLCRVFFPSDKIKIETDKDFLTEDNFVFTSLEAFDNVDAIINVKVRINNEKKFKSLTIKNDNEVDLELKMAVMLFELLSEATGYRPQWGVLTGVRPSKLMTKLISEKGEKGAFEYFINSLLVTQKKTELAMAVSKKESEIISLSKPNSFSLYVSIPFCPTRCSYCSFVSHSITSPAAKKLLPEYLELLLKELEQTAKITNDIGLKLESVYIGGGTPSILTPVQTEVLLSQICNFFDVANSREFTYEAGRPDTIDSQKLSVLKNYPVTRISINPQTFNDEVLKNIGRQHTSKQTLDVFDLACNMGFKDINMDIIAGLPMDTLSSFERTLNTALKLSPSNITVHTLALKRAASLSSDKEMSFRGNLTSNMVDLAGDMLSKSGYNPYYMYRQSKSVGNLENVGWCKNGFEGLYNVFMMEECHTVLAVGAGAVTKLKSPQNEYIERIFNFKYPYEYNTRFNLMLERKEKIYDFYK